MLVTLEGASRDTILNYQAASNYILKDHEPRGEYILQDEVPIKPFDFYMDGFSVKKAYKKGKKRVKRRARKVRRRARSRIPKFKKFKKFKKSVKVAKKYTKKTVKIANSPAGQVIIASAAASFGVPPQTTMQALQTADALVSSDFDIQEALVNLAIQQSGVPVDPNMNLNAKQMAISQLPPEQQEVYYTAFKAQEGKAKGKITRQIIKEQKKQNPESVKWTPEQIKQFNKMQSESRGGVEDIKMPSPAPAKPKMVVSPVIKESKTKTFPTGPGDVYFKQGILQGRKNEMNVLKDYGVSGYSRWFDSGAESKELDQLADLIYNQKKYPAVTFPSKSYVRKIITSYLIAAMILSENKKRNMYYTGTTESERKSFYGNLYIRITYMYFMGYKTESEAAAGTKDVNLRDRIWITLSMVRSAALKNKAYNKFWKPYSYKPKGGAVSPAGFNPMIIGGAALAIILLMTMGKKR